MRRHKPKIHITKADSFKEAINNRRVILLYPTVANRNVYLSLALEQYADNLIYFRIPFESHTQQDWIRYFILDVSASYKTFGKELNKVLEGDDLKALGTALGTDVGRLHRKQACVYLDELDRVQMDKGFVAFFHAFLEALPSHFQVIVSARTLSIDPWLQLLKGGKALVVGMEHRKTQLMFTVEEKVRPQMEVYAFGRGHVSVNGTEIVNWDGILPRNLFFYLVDNELVTRQQIFDTFWPDLPPKEATNVFHVTKRKISERISSHVEDDGEYELTHYSGGFYTPSGTIARHYDVSDYIVLVEKAMETQDDDERMTLFERALSVYRGPFLDGLDMPWANQKREKLRQMYIDSYIGIGRIYSKRKQWAEALACYTQVIRESPQREDIYREVMQTYVNLGRPEDAKRQYKNLEDYLLRALGIRPGKETTAVYQAVVDGTLQAQ